MNSKKYNFIAIWWARLEFGILLTTQGFLPEHGSKGRTGLWCPACTLSLCLPVLAWWHLEVLKFVDSWTNMHGLPLSLTCKQK